jgi:hypothetical protein
MTERDVVIERHVVVYRAGPGIVERLVRVYGAGRAEVRVVVVESTVSSWPLVVSA